MRFGRDTRIVPDESWRAGLNGAQKFFAGLLTLPNRSGRLWMYKCFPGGGLLTPLRNRLRYTWRKWTGQLSP
jgi:hypothetical protein